MLYLSKNKQMNTTAIFKASLLLLIAFFCINYSSAQNIRIAWGDGVKDKRHTNIYKLIYASSEESFILRNIYPTFVSGVIYPKDKLVLEKFDAQQNKVFEKLFEFNDKTHFYDIVLVENKLYLFYKTYDEQKKKSYFIVKLLNTENGEEAGQEKTIDSVDFSKKDNINGYIQKVRVVPGNNGIMVYSYTQTEYIVKWLNNDLSKRAEFHMKNSEKNKLSLSEPLIDKNKNLYFLCSKGNELVFDWEKEFISSYDNFALACIRWRERFQFSTIKLDSTMHTIEQLDLLLEDPKKGITQLKQVFYPDSSKIIISGFYSEKNVVSAAGHCSFIMDLSKKLIYACKIYGFSDQLKSEFRLKENQYGRKEIEKLVISNIIFNSNDSSFITLAEIKKFEYDPFTKYSMYASNFYFGNILVICSEVDGQIKWIQNISKNQKSSFDEGCHLSFCLLQNENDLGFIFMDNYKNKDKTKGETKTITMGPYIDKDATLMLCKISLNDGNITSEEIESLKPGNDNSSFCVMPKFCYFISPNKAIILSHYGSVHKVGLLQIDRE